MIRAAGPFSAGFLTARTAAALGLILLLGAALRVAMVQHAPAFIVDGDSADFFAPAYSLVQGGGFPLALKRAPLYPTFLAGVIATLGPSLEAVAVVQHALGLATVVMAYAIGALCFGRAAGLLAALWTSVSGSLLLMEHTLMSEALFTPLLLVGLLALLLALRSGRSVLFLVAGLVLGLGALTRPAAQAILPLALGVVILRNRFWKGSPAAFVVVCAGYLLITGPWLLRNRATHGVVAISGGTGDALYQRLRQHDPEFDFRDLTDTGQTGGRARLRRLVFSLAQNHKYSDEIRVGLLEEYPSLSEAQIDAALREAALQVIRQEPERYLRGTLAMFWKLALGRDKPLHQFWETRYDPTFARSWPASVRFVMQPAPRPSEDDWSLVEGLTAVDDARLGGLVGVLFVVGTIGCLARGRPGLVLLPLVVLTQLLLYATLDGPLARYRYPMQPLITLVAAAGFAPLVTLMTNRRWAGRLLPAALARRLGVAAERAPSPS